MNPFVQFLQLLPKQPLLIGTVISSGSGTTQVELPGGARVTVRGAGTVGGKVFVRNGLVEGEAPNLPTGTIEV